MRNRITTIISRFYDTFSFCPLHGHTHTTFPKLKGRSRDQDGKTKTFPKLRLLFAGDETDDDIWCCISELRSISHITWTSLYAHVWTSLCSFANPTSTRSIRRVYTGHHRGIINEMEIKQDEIELIITSLSGFNKRGNGDESLLDGKEHLLPPVRHHVPLPSSSTATLTYSVILRSRFFVYFGALTYTSHTVVRKQKLTNMCRF